MRRPLVSVVMPTYQSERFVEEAVNSVLCQTMHDLELLVADDGSTDRTVEFLKGLEERDKRLRVVSTERVGGPGPARNAAIAEAEGSLIAFLDSDDSWFPRKLERQLRLMHVTGAALSYTGYQRIDEAGNSLSVVSPPSTVTRERLLRRNVIACSTAIYSKRLLGRRFMASIPRGQDYAMWLELLKSCDAAVGLSEPLASYRVRSRSVSSNKIESAINVWRLYREVGVHSNLKAGWYFVNYTVGGVRQRSREAFNRPRRSTSQLLQPDHIDQRLSWESLPKGLE